MKPPELIDHDGHGNATTPQPSVRPSPSRRRVVRRVAARGLLGALPGLLIALVPLVLSDFGVISSDASQIGFIGLPVLIIGTLVGISTAAADGNCVGTAMIGAGTGFVIGLTAGLLSSTGLRALGAEVAGIWLFLTPIGMTSFAAAAVHLRLRHHEHKHEP